MEGRWWRWDEKEEGLVDGKGKRREEKEGKRREGRK